MQGMRTFAEQVEGRHWNIDAEGGSYAEAGTRAK
jgi:hypothetical protein